MFNLTIQAYLPNVDEMNQSQWADIAVIEFDEDFKIKAFSYVNEHASHFLADNHFSVSINYPVELFAYATEQHWLAFLDDMIPAGASRRYWLTRLDLARLSVHEQNYQLLKHATISPVGHLRIKESIPDNQGNYKIFSLMDVINRDVDFLEYANEMGAMAGGATGAGGEAPKLLLRLNKSNEVWIDNQQLAEVDDAYYLVKYPRGSRSQLDCDILRVEYHYYHELSEMGYQTISTKDMKLIEGQRYPSLWLPRFDIQITNGITKRYAMESVYSMLQKGTGAYLKHGDSLRALIKQIETSQMVKDGFVFDRHAFIVEWVRRDLLNIAFGNSDNHGRNTAFLRDENGIYLAPIFDFAPMKADPEGIVRSIKWQNPMESGGNFDFKEIADSLSDLIEPTSLLDELKTTAHHLHDLKQRLATRGVPASILDFPAIGLDYLPEKLKRWGLLT